KIKYCDINKMNDMWNNIYPALGDVTNQPAGKKRSTTDITNTTSKKRKSVIPSVNQFYLA
ncbi:1131_t:CDS:1, partial [Ambispora gerdemannii]